MTFSSVETETHFSTKCGWTFEVNFDTLKFNNLHFVKIDGVFPICRMHRKIFASIIKILFLTFLQVLFSATSWKSNIFHKITTIDYAEKIYIDYVFI